MRRGESDADAFFRADAVRLGYAEDDAHAPGNGRGLWAYYRDHGMQPPEVLRRNIPSNEQTGLDLDQGFLDDAYAAVEQDGKTPWRDHGRHSQPVRGVE